MKEENNGASKNKWSRIFRKKWFFPAVYLTIAALLLTVVVWYQNVDNQVQDGAQDNQEQSEDYTPNPADQDAETVVGQQEIVEMPVENPDKAEIVTKFYDYNADEKDQESALVLYNNRYYQSTGIDIAQADGETFDVMASLSGSVTNVKEDPLLGNVVELTHENEVTTYYASLGEISVKAGDEVKQGDVLGTAGKNLFGKDSGTHVHFELRKDGKEVNPEAFFNQPVSSLDKALSENAEDDSKATEESGATSESDSTTDESGVTDESDATDESSDATDDSNTTDDSEATDESDATSDENAEEPSGSEEDSGQTQDEETDASNENSVNESSESSASSASA
ncbi:M23 family metallopeptidase [Virgibacillus ndiopensis]|uniref:M23 family metallopeptidase n=1 Tax=Virgibacillus ndiopensis TaxID=2004408 RepID=UPI000C084410|nr:M23 family metallopeptidase [Virgibacillus ndiopensis]